MRPQPGIPAAILYGLLVFGGTAALGFVVAPALGTASGLFPIEAEAAAFFSLLTLRGVPYLVGLSALSGLLYRNLAPRGHAARLACFVGNVLLAWLIAAAIAFAILG